MRRRILFQAQYQRPGLNIVPAAAGTGEAALPEPSTLPADEPTRVDIDQAFVISDDLAAPACERQLAPEGTPATDSDDRQRGTNFQSFRELLCGSKPVVWVFAGDSITQGAHHTDGQRNYCEHFAERIHSQLHRHYDVVINASVPGETAQSLLADLEWRILRFRPDAVSVMIGINDATAGHKGRSEFRRNLEHIVQCIRADKALLLLHTPPRVDVERVNTRADLRSYVRLVRDVARELDVPCVDHWAFWKMAAADGGNINAWLAADGLHPTAEGHRHLAKLLFKRFGIARGRTTSG